MEYLPGLGESPGVESKSKFIQVVVNRRRPDCTAVGPAKESFHCLRRFGNPQQFFLAGPPELVTRLSQRRIILPRRPE
jgi:hypothetical protein